MFLLELCDGDIAEPNDLAVVLEANVPFPREVFEGFLEFVGGAVGVFSGCVPILDIYLKALFAIDVAGNDGTFEFEMKGIPEPNGSGEVFGGGLGVVEGAIEFAWRQFPLLVFLEALVVHDLDFEPVLHGVLGVRSVEYAGIGTGSDFVKKGEFEVAVSFLRPDVAFTADVFHSIGIDGLLHTANHGAIFFDFPGSGSQVEGVEVGAIKENFGARFGDEKSRRE